MGLLLRGRCMGGLLRLLRCARGLLALAGARGTAFGNALHAAFELERAE